MKAPLRETDVTDLVKKEGWTGRETSLAVIIVAQMGKGGKMGREEIILNPKEKRRHYGDLLKKYS